MMSINDPEEKKEAEEEEEVDNNDKIYVPLSLSHSLIQDVALHRERERAGKRRLQMVTSTMVSISKKMLLV